MPIILIVGFETQLTLPSQYLGLKQMIFGITSRKMFTTLHMMWEHIQLCPAISMPQPPYFYTGSVSSGTSTQESTPRNVSADDRFSDGFTLHYFLRRSEPS
jgi:hypothetical protein